jgi:hypothetical protein
VDFYFSNLGNTIENISPLLFLTLDTFTIFGFFTLANYLLTFDCNVPDLASLGNAANVCVGLIVYNI